MQPESEASKESDEAGSTPLFNVGATPVGATPGM